MTELSRLKALILIRKGHVYTVSLYTFIWLADNTLARER